MEETKSIVANKSKDFAIRIISLYKYLKDYKQEYVLSKQLLRSGTSIGANVSEALAGYSKREFLAKMYIAYKEGCETRYWLELLNRASYIDEKEYDSLNSDCSELIRILSSIPKTVREQLLTPNS